MKLYQYICADPENFVVRGGPTLTSFFLFFFFVFFFLVDEGWVDRNRTIIEPSSARTRNAILLPR